MSVRDFDIPICSAVFASSARHLLAYIAGATFTLETFVGRDEPSICIVEGLHFSHAEQAPPRLMHCGRPSLCNFVGSSAYRNVGHLVVSQHVLIQAF